MRLLCALFQRPAVATTSLLNVSRAALTTLLLGTLLIATRQVQAMLMNLPDGIESVLGFAPRTTFQCERDGYFGDIDNDCRLFHLCQRSVSASGRVEWRHWTYACGNQTMFNQLTLTCAFVDEAIPCRHASQFQYLNEVIHKPAEPFLTDADVTSGFSYYSNRVMSDGARARAFHDSQLLAQIGGQQQPGAESFGASASPNAIDNSLDGDTTGVNLQFQHFQQVTQPQRQSQPQPQTRFELRETFGPAHLTSQRAAAAHPQSPQLEWQLPRATSASDSSSSAQVDVTSSSSRQQSFAAAPSFQSLPVESQQQQQAPNSANQQQSFEFSIATNHGQAGGISAEPAVPSAGVFFGSQQQQPAQAQAQPLQPFQSADQLRQQFASLLPPPAEPITTTTTTTTTLTPTTSATSASRPTTSAPVELISTSAASVPLVPNFTHSQRLATTPEATQPTIATTSTTTFTPQQTSTSGTLATTTTTAATSVAASQQSRALAGAQSEPARRSASIQQQTQRQQVAGTQNTAPAATASNRRSSSRPERVRSAGFQSTRLSSSSSRAQKRQAETPIVMRKQAPTSAATSSSGSGASPARSSSALVDVAQASGVSLGTADFWRRSFDAQLMAPKFESLLLRRRV